MLKQICYEGEPSPRTQLTDKEIIFILEDHFVEHRYQDGVLMMCDEYSQNGINIINWIEPIRKYGELMRWLGY